MKSFSAWLEKWLGGGVKGTTRINTMRWILIIGLVGISMMILNSFVTIRDVGPIDDYPPNPWNEQQVVTAKVSQETKFLEYEESYASSLKEILEKVIGIGTVEVLVTIESTEEVIVQLNSKETQQLTDEKDQQGASRHITDISRTGEVALYNVSNSQTPIIVKQIKPKIRGVLIVAKGAENMTVKQIVIEAIERGLGVAPHRISVIPMKQ